MRGLLKSELLWALLMVAGVAVLTISAARNEAGERGRLGALTTALLQAEIRLVVAHHRSLSWCAPVEAMDWCADELNACQLRRGQP